MSPSDPSVSAGRAFDTLAEDGWHVAKLRLPDDTTALRCCLLKREHAAIVPQLAAALAERLGAQWIVSPASSIATNFSIRRARVSGRLASCSR